MKDQHTKIKGYRDLSQVEVDLMNAIKEKAEEVYRLIVQVEAHLWVQDEAAFEDDDEYERLAAATPFVWIGCAQQDLQAGFMKLVRSVAQPTSF